MGRILTLGAVVLALFLVQPSCGPGALLAENQPWQVQSRGLVLVDESKSARESGLPPIDEDLRLILERQPTHVIPLRFLPEQSVSFELELMWRILPVLLGLSVRPRRASAGSSRVMETIS